MKALVGKSVYLDSNILILAIEQGNSRTTLLRELFESIEAGLVVAFTSELSLAEVLAKPLEAGADDLVSKYEALFVDSSPIAVVTIDRTILRRSAELRSQLGLKLIDAIHVSTAIESGCDAFLSEDIRLGRKLAQPGWVSLDRIATGNV